MSTGTRAMDMRAAAAVRSFAGSATLALVHGVMSFTMAGAIPAVGSAQTPGTAAPLVFDEVTVVDVEHGRLLPAQRVVIVGSRIQAVGAAGAVKTPKGARVVDARGQYLIPGLWDMHVHIRQHTPMYSLLVANGVTGMREMSVASDAERDSMFQWRREIAAGARVGPRSVVTGRWIGGPNGKYVNLETALSATTPDEGRRAVQALNAAGADFVKVRVGLSRDVYYAVAAESRRLGIPLVGHLLEQVTAEEASDSGQRSLEHMESLYFRCTGGEIPDLVQRMIKAPAIDAERCAAVAAHLARNGTWITPTLMWEHSSIVPVARELYQYWPDTLPRPKPQPNNPIIYRPLYRRYHEVLQIMRQAHVPILAGTDAVGDRIQIAGGFGLHQELANLVEAGLSPLEALQAATIQPARFLGAADSMGGVASGKVADLVLLDADPSTDIRNTTNIVAVVANGRYFDRAALDSLLAEVRSKAKTMPPIEPGGR